MTYYDGRTRVAREADLRPGVVLRLQYPDGTIGTFSDCIVTRVHDGTVTAGRPCMIRKDPIGAMQSEYVVWVETFDVPISRLTTVDSIFRIVLNAKGDVVGGPCDD